jgi:hypothetical protein
MYKVKNNRTGKFIKNALTGKPFTFEDKDHAQKWADDSARESVLNATAWNSVRRSTFSVVEC